MTVLPNTKTIADPTLKDLFDLHKKQIMLSFNCHAVAIVQGFDPITQTVEATIAYKKTVLVRQANGTYAQELRDYPVLLNCPIIVLQGGVASLTFPIQEGDTCLILFSDRDIDNWLISGQVSAVNSTRMHAFSDGIALVGLNSFNETFENYDADRVVLRNGLATKIAVSKEKIEISNLVASLGPAIDQLLTVFVVLLSAMETANPANVVATIAVPSAAALIQVQLVKVLLKGLLE